jgi:hypothetical protein
VSASDQEARQRWEGRVRHRGIYLFFNQPIELLTDSETVFQEFDTIYHRFRLRRALASESGLRPLFLLQAYPKEGFFLYLSGRSFQIPDRPDRMELYQFLFNYLLDQTRDFFIIHGAALADREQGLILAAASGLGKSTLTLELLRRGKKFLSDELACLDREGGELRAFPRALSISRPVLEGFLEAGGGKLPSPERIIEDQTKIMIDVEALFPNPYLTRCRLQTIVFIEPPALTPHGDQTQTMELRLFTLSADFLEALRKTAGLVELTAHLSGDSPMIRLAYQANVHLVPIIQSLANKHGVAIRSFYPEGKAEIDYRRPPQLYTMKPSAGILLLCRYVLNVPVNPDDPDSGRQRLLASLARGTRGVRFYRMTPGPLAAMADRIETLND